MMTDEELATWAETRPEAVRLAIAVRDPRKLYRMQTGHIISIYCYNEGMCTNPECFAHKESNVTLTVVIQLKNNPDLLFERRVFGIHLEDLVEVPAGTIAAGKL